MRSVEFISQPAVSGVIMIHSQSNVPPGGAADHFLPM